MEEPKEQNSFNEHSLEAPIPQVVPVEVPRQPAVVPPPAPAQMPQNHAITLVLQWLTYAFWGWFALAMTWISAVVFAYFILGSDSQDWTSIVAYPIAATIVLFLVAAVIDFFYARIEPVRKEGFAIAVMVIHAVIFALFGIGALISAVFTIISLVLSGSNKTSLVVLYASLVALVIYAILIVRATLVSKIRRLPLIATGVLGLFAVGFIVTSIVGPVAQSLVTKQDRDLEMTLPTVVSKISEYATNKGTLPTSLSQLSFTSLGYDGVANPQDVINKGVIEYTPNIKPSDNGSSSDGSMHTNATTNTKYYYYRLCVTYTAEKKDVNGYGYSTSSTAGYQSYIYTSAHGKGKQCYDLSTDIYRPVLAG